MDNLRVLPAMNPNYDPPQPWKCLTQAEHDCTGEIIGAIGAYPVCEPGSAAERSRLEAHRKRIADWAASPEGRETLAQEWAAEQRFARRYNA